MIVLAFCRLGFFGATGEKALLQASVPTETHTVFGAIWSNKRQNAPTFCDIADNRWQSVAKRGKVPKSAKKFRRGASFAFNEPLPPFTTVLPQGIRNKVNDVGCGTPRGK